MWSIYNSNLTQNKVTLFCICPFIRFTTTLHLYILSLIKIINQFNNLDLIQSHKNKILPHIEQYEAKNEVFQIYLLFLHHKYQISKTSQYSQFEGLPQSLVRIILNLNIFLTRLLSLVPRISQRSYTEKRIKSRSDFLRRKRTNFSVYDSAYINIHTKQILLRAFQILKI